MKRKLVAQGAVRYVIQAGRNMEMLGIKELAIAIAPDWFDAIVQEIGGGQYIEGNDMPVIRLCIHGVWVYPTI